MSNGAACCALEICCPDAASKRDKLTLSIARFTNADPTHCSGFLDWMAANDLVFAPKEFQATMNAIADIVRNHP